MDENGTIKEVLKPRETPRSHSPLRTFCPIIPLDDGDDLAVPCEPPTSGVYVTPASRERPPNEADSGDNLQIADGQPKDELPDEDELEEYLKYACGRLQREARKETAKAGTAKQQAKEFKPEDVDVRSK
jgi:hypothetical protein